MSDDFWDIDKLLPKRTQIKSPSVPKNLVGELSKISIGNIISNGVSIKDISEVEFAQTNENEFDFSDKSVILKSAVVSDWKNSYTYNKDFKKYAKIYNETFSPENAEYVPFFSYMPQYSDLNNAQNMRYLWWRERIRHGEYPMTDLSYIFLYIFEIFALDDIIQPSLGIKIIIDMWRVYHKEHDGLNKYLCDWIVDFSILHNTPIILSELCDILPDVKIKQQSILFDMFLFDYVFKMEESLNYKNINLICEILSNYNPYKSKYCADDNFKLALESTLEGLLNLLRQNGFFDLDGGYLRRSELKISRPSYLGAVCSVSTKKNLSITYFPCVSNEIVRLAFSNLLKHIENRIRAVFGIKNRLSNVVLPADIKIIIDEYFALQYSPSSKKHKFYKSEEKDPPPPQKIVSVDFSKAKNIESSSWETTAKLTEGLEVEEEIQFEQESAPQTYTSPSGLISLLTPPETLILKAMLNDSSTNVLENIARENNLFLDTAVDSINEKSLQIIGDTIIDTSEYTIIGDYLEELSALNNI